MKALIVTGEPSGDLYGGKLALALKERLASLTLAGMGGSEMAAAGAELLYHYGDVTVLGVFEVASKLRHLKQASSQIKQWVRSVKPDFAVLIDFPDFNFRIARFLKSQGVPIFYFISPQVWAWRKNRIYFLKEHVNLMICILPFELKMYQKAGVPAIYVGHPLVEIVREKARKELPFYRTGTPLIGIMPGSRDVEVRRHLPVLLDTLAVVQKAINIENVLIWPPWLDAERYAIPSWARLQKENRYTAMQAADLLLVTSGTSTLEAAILGTPLFIVYKVGGVSWQLGKILVRVPFYGLVNWIAQRECIPEYIQERMNPELLATDALQFLQNETKRMQMKSNLTNIVEDLGPPGAIERAADAIVARL